MTIPNKELTSFLSKLEKLPDIRTKEGKRHTQEVVLIIVLFATMSGYLGYRAMGDFAKKHKDQLVELLRIEKSRVPSYSTIRRVLMQVCIKSFEQAYKSWLQELRSSLVNGSLGSQNSQEGQEKQKVASLENWYSGDGKFIRGANKSRSSSEQINLVSIMSSFDKVVYQSKGVASKSNEIPCVQKMIQESDLEGVIFTLDPLHCQKKQLPILKSRAMIM